MNSKLKSSQHGGNILEVPNNINCEEFAISLLKNYGDTLYILLNYEGITDEKKLGDLLSKIIEKSCLKINSPEAYKAKPAIFTSAYQVLCEVNLQNSLNTNSKVISPMLSINPYLHILHTLSFEKRFAYILKIRNKLTYRELESVLNLHRAEISTLLTEAREQIRLSLSTKNILPFNQRTLLCSLTYQHLSPYLDNELNILHTIDVENHLKNCDNCLKILADHQYIEKKLEDFPQIPEDKLIRIYFLSLSSKDMPTISSSSTANTTKKQSYKSTDEKNTLKNLLNKILRLLKKLIQDLSKNQSNKKLT